VQGNIWDLPAHRLYHLISVLIIKASKMHYFSTLF